MKKKLTDRIGGDEQILWQSKKAKGVSIMESVFHPMLPLVLLWAMFDAVVLIGAFLEENVEVLGLRSILTIHLLPFWLYLAEIVISLLRAWNTEYCITDKAVYVQSGILSKATVVRKLADLQSAVSIRGVFDKLFGTGDVELFFYDLVSTSGNDVRVKSRFVKKPFELSICNLKEYEMVKNLVLELRKEAKYDEAMASWPRQQCVSLSAAPGPQKYIAQPPPDPRKAEMADLVMPESSGQDSEQPEGSSGQNLPAGS